MDAPPAEPVPGEGPWQALAPALPWRRGVLAPTAPEGVAVEFSWLDERAGVARYRLAHLPRHAGLTAAAACAAMAAAGAPVLGDLRFGGVLVAGGLRLRLAGDGPLPEGDWPGEPVFAPDLETRIETRVGTHAEVRVEERAAGAAPRALAVSAATLRALVRGHPWVLRDAETGDTACFRPGALVPLAEDAGARVRVEPVGPVAARLWTRETKGRGPSIEARVAAALRRRESLRHDRDRTTAYRLIHGEADGLPGLALDRLGPLLRLLLTARCAEPLVERVLDAVTRGLRDELGANPGVVAAICLRAAPRGQLEGVRVMRGPAPALDGRGRLQVRERGLELLVAPGLAEPCRPRPGVGLFLDQRENRARVAQRACAGGRYLNLFAHTGAFSAALLAAGAGEVVSVDLSAAYLRWLEANLAANRLATRRHRAVRSDGRRFLERLDAAERSAGIVLDPPTAAAAGRRFWSVRRDLEPLAAQALRRLVPGGWLLLTRNDRRATSADEAWLEGIARRAGVALARVEPAPPGPDFPGLACFPEGDPFRGWLLSRS
jgi:23S rRNA (cytosine1962-C5)-methyltransferase